MKELPLGSFDNLVFGSVCIRSNTYSLLQGEAHKEKQEGDSKVT